MPQLTPTLPPATHTNAVIIGTGASSAPPHRSGDPEQGAGDIASPRGSQDPEDFGVLVVDPGSAYPREQEQLMQRVRAAGGRAKALFLTHHHGDHTAGAASLAARLGCPVLAHPYTLDRLELPAGVPALPLDEGAALRVGDRVLEVLQTPGHAPGHLCLWDPGRRVLVGGDMALGLGTTIIDPEGGGDMGEYLASLRRLRALRSRVILPGHGPPLDRPEAALTRLLEHRRWREERVQAALGSRPRALDRLTRAAYTDVPPRLLPLAARSALAHLHHLRGRGAAAELDGGWVRTGDHE